ncbi:ISL3 family transposase [Kitasatospora sp. DSM 101779]|uniref:ISL3 family transposase n=1 Tax=Kitasatospora sp. DSM 101779 TaxID=2853165 RepID=UPI0021D92EF7|nr:ISL3 family transposase [Kitasatospora sp. DSM 101779]MCU7821118.1 ISL3 family transposase [Kitasatospora sp. DSM 101779]MCU7821148.1 ISL3 family transposase [Kitasatospora sp. DSM 101779]
MTDALHQNLWLQQASDVAVNSLTIQADRVTVHAATTSDEAGCPSCGTVSARVHSSYVRRLDDSAASGRRVVVELRVRRFRCRERMCPRSTFVEQAAGLTFRHGRRSQSLQTALQQLALALAGRAGSRLAETFAVPVSRSTLLRLIRALPDPASPVPRVLGIDEFALRKGHVYATVLVDIETRRAVDLLPDRTVATVRSWLAGHPGVEVVCRDRSASYAEAVRLGAPDAIHVADRFHLWQNLSDAVEKTVLQHRALLPEAAPSTLSAKEVVFPSVAAEPRRTGRLSDRVREQHATVHALMEDGFSLRVIARRLGLARGTVRRLARAKDPDELLVGRWTGRTSILDPYKPYLHQRFSEGHTIARRLFEEIQQRGFPGQEQIVREYVRRLRTAFPHQAPPRRKPSVRDVTGWITRHPDRLSTDASQQLKEVLARVPALATTAEHVRTFAELMNDRRGRELKDWITRVQQDQVPALRSFATGLLQDLDAVVAGLTLRYSSGAVEGHNNKIKMLKRQMFGRANFDLLRKRVLHAA